MKKSPQRRRKHCTLAVVRRSQKFPPLQTPFPGAQDGQNLISYGDSAGSIGGGAVEAIAPPPPMKLNVCVFFKSVFAAFKNSANNT